MSEMTKDKKGVSTERFVRCSHKTRQKYKVLFYDACGDSLEQRYFQCETIENMAARTVGRGSKNSAIGFLLSRDKKEKRSVLYGSS